MGQGTSRDEREKMVHGWPDAGTTSSMHWRDTTLSTSTKANTLETLSKKRANRMVVWEVSIARGCIDSFNRMLTAHAIVLSLLVTVNLVGFFQPPRGDDSSGRMFPHSKPLIAFSLFNSASLYTATCGLLFYIYCCHSAIVSLQSVPLPDGSDDPDFSDDLLHNLRATLRCVTLPSIRRRCAYIFSLLACSLTWCMAAYISAGIAATNPGQLDRWIGVIVPAVPGCIGMLFVLNIAAAKLRLELDFPARLQRLWGNMGGTPVDDPGVRPISKEDIHALDPLPHVLWWWYHARPEEAQLMAAHLFSSKEHR